MAAMWMAMIMYYDKGLRNLQQHLWNELNFALCATFHLDLHPHELERLHKDDPHTFTELAIDMAGRCHKKGPGRPASHRAAVQPAAPARSGCTCTCDAGSTDLVPEMAEVPPRGKASPIMWGWIRGSHTRN